MFGLKKQKEAFLDNLGILVGSGMDIVSALKSLETETKSRRMKKVISEIVKAVEDGNSLDQAFKNTKAFSPYTITLLKAGEFSGQLAEYLALLTKSHEKNRKLNGKILSSLLYPLFVLVVLLIVGALVSIFLFPRLADVFSSIGSDLPWISKALIGFGNFLENNGLIAIPSFFVVLILLFYFLFRYPKTKILGQKFLLHLPIIKNLIVEIELSRLGFILSGLLKGGLSIIESLRLLGSVTPSLIYRRFYQHLEHSLSEGESLKQSFASYKKHEKLVPHMIENLIMTGEKSGNLTNVLEKIGKRYEEKSSQSAKNLTVFIEPVLLIIVWLGVLAVAMAVIFPIYNLVNQY